MVKVLILLIWVLCAFAALNRREIRELRKLAARFEGSLARYSLFVPTITAIWEGRSFRVHAGPRFLEVPGTLVIRLFLRPPVLLRVFRRSLLGKAAGKVRLLSEVRTGDPAFDAEFAVFTHDVHSAGSCLQQTAIKHGLLALFECGFWMLVIDDRGVWAEKLAYDRISDLAPDFVSSVLRLLRVVATAV